MRKTMPSHYEIFEYWKDKKIGKEWVLYDYGEPQCWACGKSILVETDEELATSNYKSIWKKTAKHLNRCHIVADSLGGENEPDNLFLMCEGCHHESPDTTSRDSFFTWVLLKRSRCIWGEDAKTFMADLAGMCDIRGIGVSNIFAFLSQKCIPKFISELVVKTSCQGGRYSKFNLPSLIIDEYGKENIKI